MASVTYDRKNGELHNDVAFFAQFASRPDDIRWTVAPGDTVRPGQELGRFVWPGQPSDCVITAPLGCGGVVATINRGVVCRFLGRSPSQVLMVMRRPFRRAAGEEETRAEGEHGEEAAGPEPAGPEPGGAARLDACEVEPHSLR